MGEVFVTQKGMFRHIQCKCTGTGKGLHLMAVSGMCRIDLGVFPSEAQGGTIERWVPAKTLPMTEDMSFVLEWLCTDRFIPLIENEPFGAVGKLSAGRFEVRGGVPGIVLPDQRSISRPTGQ